MRKPSWNSAEIMFLDRQRVLADLRQAVAEAKARYPEIVRVYLIGSLVRGDWSATSDADMVVVVRRDFADILERSCYQTSILTDTLIYSEREFEQLAAEPDGFLARNLAEAVEL